MQERVIVRERSALGPILVFIAVVGIVIAALFATGIVSFSRRQEGVDITVNTRKAEEATDKAMYETGRALKKAGEELQKK